jgi:hypothetical protein
VLRQCTDTTRFTAPADEAAILERRDVVFVANSRGVRRDILGWAIEAGFPPAIVGRHWGGLELGRLVKRDYVENDELPEFLPLRALEPQRSLGQHEALRHHQ